VAESQDHGKAQQKDDFLETRLRRLEDIEDIRGLFVEYGRALDAGELETFAALFTEDGRLQLGPLGSATGRSAIVALMTKAIDGLVGSSFHIIGSPTIRLDGDTATSEVMWTVIHRQPDGSPRLTMTGRHRDELVRTVDGWRIAKRRGFIDLPSTFPGS